MGERIVSRDMDQKCDIIIPVWNNLDLTKDCIEHLMRNTDTPYRIIAVDNASDDRTSSYLDGLSARTDALVIHNDTNLGFIKAVNQALAVSSAPFICVLNNDTIPAEGWLRAMIDFAREHPDVGLINPQCDGHGSAPIGEYARSLRSEKGNYMEMNQCQGFCMLMKRKLVDSIGLLDEAFGIGGFDDTDYSMRAHKAGFRCVAIRDAYVYHRQHGSFDKSQDREEWVRRNEKIFIKKWGRPLRFAVAASFHEGAWEKDARDLLVFCYGLAREWSWVHLWLNFKKPMKLRAELVLEILRSEDLPPHQNFKVSVFSMPEAVFYLTVFGKLLERIKPRMAKKRFNAFMTTDERLAGFLAPFSAMLMTRSCPIDVRDIGNAWHARAKDSIRRLNERDHE